MHGAALRSGPESIAPAAGEGGDLGRLGGEAHLPELFGRELIAEELTLGGAEPDVAGGSRENLQDRRPGRGARLYLLGPEPLSLSILRIDPSEEAGRRGRPQLAFRIDGQARDVIGQSRAVRRVAPRDQLAGATVPHHESAAAGSQPDVPDGVAHHRGELVIARLLQDGHVDSVGAIERPHLGEPDEPLGIAGDVAHEVRGALVGERPTEAVLRLPGEGGQSP